MKRFLFCCVLLILKMHASLRDVSFLLEHAECELRNPVLFQEGVCDLLLVFRHGLYRNNPLLEKKLIGLVARAQKKAAVLSQDARSVLTELSSEVFDWYRGTRYALDIHLSSQKDYKLSERSALPLSVDMDYVQEAQSDSMESQGDNGKVQSVKAEDVLFLSEPKVSRMQARKKRANVKKARAAIKKKVKKKVTKKRTKKTTAARSDLRQLLDRQIQKGTLMTVPLKEHE